MWKPLFESEMGHSAPRTSLRGLCETRRSALVAARAALSVDVLPTERRELEDAIQALDGLLTGELDRIPEECADRLRAWLGTSRYLGAGRVR